MENSNNKDIRQRWQEFCSGSDPLTKNELYSILQRNSLIGRLRRRALRLFFIGCLGPFLILYLDTLIPISTPLLWSYSLLMLFCAFLNLYWWYRLGDVYKYMTVPLIEAQREMDKLSRLRRIIKLCCWIGGAPVIIFFYYELHRTCNDSIFLAAVVGGAIGLVIGLTLEYLTWRQVNSLRRSFYEGFE